VVGGPPCSASMAGRDDITELNISPSRRDAASVDARTGTPAAAAATHAAAMHARTNAPVCPILPRTTPSFAVSQSHERISDMVGHAHGCAQDNAPTRAAVIRERDEGGGRTERPSAGRGGCVAAARRASTPRARASRFVLLAALVGSTLRSAGSVPMGARDLEDGDTVPPPHYGTKHLDLSKARPVVSSGDVDEFDFGEPLPNQKLAPSRPQGQIRAVPQIAQVQSLLETDGGRNPGEEGERGQESQKSSVWAVALNTLLMAVASGLGAAPFFFVSNVNRKWLGIANALASGVMLAASFGLVQEGLDGVRRSEHSLLRLVAGMILGLVFIIVSEVCIAFPSLRALCVQRPWCVLHGLRFGSDGGAGLGSKCLTDTRSRWVRSRAWMRARQPWSWVS
jgi:hypothetical protein